MGRSNKSKKSSIKKKHRSSTESVVVSPANCVHLMDVDGGSIFVLRTFVKVPLYRGVYINKTGEVQCQFVNWNPNRLQVIEKIKRFLSSGTLDGVMRRGRSFNARAEGIDWESDVVKVITPGYITIKLTNHKYRPRFYQFEDESKPIFIGTEEFDTYEAALKVGLEFADDFQDNCPVSFSIETYR